MSLIEVLWRRKVVVLGATVVSGVIALAVTMTLPQLYRADATVLVTPPMYRTDVSPPPPSPETYSEIALTPSAVEGALQRAGLTEADGWNVDTTRRRLRVETYEERGNYNSVLISPLLGLVVSDVDPERAARLANAWAESFQEVSLQFQGRGTSRIAQALEERAATATAQLSSTEEALGTFDRESLLATLETRARIQAESLAQVHGSRLRAETEMQSKMEVLAVLEREAQVIAAGDGPAGSLGGRILQADDDLDTAAAAVRDYRQESAILVLEEELSFRKKLLAQVRDEARILQGRLAQATAEVERIAGLVGEASGESPAAPLRASLATDSGSDGDGPLPVLNDMILLEQLQDTALQALRTRYYGARVDAESLGPLLESYEARTVEIEASLPTLEVEVNRHRDALSRLESRRQVQVDRSNDLDRLQRELHGDIASLALEIDRLRAEATAHLASERTLGKVADAAEARVLQVMLHRDHLQRELNLARQLHANLSGKAQEARAAEAGSTSDVSIVSRAAIPQSPVSPRPALNTAAAALFGLLASSALVVLTTAPSRN